MHVRVSSGELGAGELGAGPLDVPVSSGELRSRVLLESYSGTSSIRCMSGSCGDLGAGELGAGQLDAGELETDVLWRWELMSSGAACYLEVILGSGASGGCPGELRELRDRVPL